MSKVTVSQLAGVLGVDNDKLLVQLKDAGIEASKEDNLHGDAGFRTWGGC